MIKWLLLLISTAAIAQQQGMNPHDPGPMDGGSETRTFNKEFGKKPEKKADVISGICIVEAGGGNLMATPCTDVILTLKPSKGETISTRTEHDGTFQFSTAQGESYKLSSGSKFYDVVSPTSMIHAGLNIEVHLKQK